MSESPEERPDLKSTSIETETNGEQIPLPVSMHRAVCQAQQLTFQQPWQLLGSVTDFASKFRHFPQNSEILLQSEFHLVKNFEVWNLVFHCRKQY